MKIKLNFIKYFRKRTAEFMALLLTIGPAIAIGNDIISYGAEQNFYIPTVVDERPIVFENGGFEEFTDTGAVASNNWGYISHDDVPGWNTTPIDTSLVGSIYADCIEIQRGGYIVDAVDGEYYAELNAQYPSYLYEVCNTVPGSRVYYTFYHKAYPGYKDVMEFYLKSPDGNVPSKNPIIVCSDTSSQGDKSDWTKYSGLYIIPEGQDKTEFGFKSVSSENILTGESFPTRGNFLDDISLKTGAAVYLNKTSDKDLSQDAAVDDIVTYTIDIANKGEIAASNVILTDILGDDVTYVGNVKINSADAGAHAEFDEAYDTLTVKLDNIHGLSPEKLTVSYDVKIKPFEGSGGSTHIVRNQASIHYNDYGYEDYPENMDGYTSYSNIHELPVTKPIATSSVAIRKIWKNDNKIVRPENIQVQLIRDDIAYGSPVTLNEDNNWSYVWNNLIDEKPEGYSDIVIGDDDTEYEPYLYSFATPSDSVEYENDIKPSTSSEYRWTVKEVDVPFGYKCEIIESDNNIYTIVNTFSEGGGITSGGNSGGTSQKPSEKKELKIVKKLVSGDDSPGSYNRYEIEVSNKGNVPIYGVRIRDYMPEYTYFSACDELGSYGVISGKEHVTWFISELAEGESKTLWVEIRIDSCAGKAIYNVAGYEITNTTQPPDTNDPNDPAMKTEPAGVRDMEETDVEIMDEPKSIEELIALKGWNSPHSLPKTGDSDKLYLWMTMFFSGIAMMIFTIKKNRDN